ncbi:outer membrane protein assembly factor BamB family protein [Nocardia thraciensis]
MLVLAATGHGHSETGGLDAVSPELRFLLGACLSADRNLRPTAAELARALSARIPDAPLGPPAPLPSSDTATPARSGLSRRTLLTGAGVGLGVLGAGGLIAGLAVRERSRESASPPGTVLWKTDIGAAMSDMSDRDKREPPAVLGDSVFAGSVDGSVYALDTATGAVRWRTPIGQDAPIYAPIAAAGRVFVSHSLRGLCALDAATGAILWEKDGYYGRLATDGTLVFSRGPRSYRGVNAWDAASGALRWVAIPDRGTDMLAPTTADGLLAMTGDHFLYMVSVSTGTLLWQTGPPGLYFSGANRPILGGGLVFAWSSGAHQVYDALGGAPRWVGVKEPFDDVVVVGDTAFLMGRSVEARITGTGAVRWSHPIPESKALAVAADTVFVTLTRQLRALDAATGEEKWRYNHPVELSRAAIAHRTAYLIGDDHHIHAIRT